MAVVIVAVDTVVCMVVVDGGLVVIFVDDERAICF